MDRARLALAGLISSVPRRMGLAQDDAADVFQTVTIFLYQRLGSIRDRARLGAWLLTTAARETMRGVLVEKDLRDYCPPQAATT